MLGIFAGAVLSIPIFYLVFLKLPSQLFALELKVPYAMDPTKYPMPAATVWKAVADVLAEGIHTIPPSAQIAALAGIVVGLILEMWQMAARRTAFLSRRSPWGLAS